jgi:hypothetical protein
MSATAGCRTTSFGPAEGETARDPDILALAIRLGLRGLRYRSFAPAPIGVAAAAPPADPPTAGLPMSGSPAPDSPAPEFPASGSPAPVFPIAGSPAPEPRQPDARPPDPPVPERTLPVLAVSNPPATPAAPHAARAAAEQPRALAFPLLAQVFARGAGTPPSPAADPAAPFAALRHAVGGIGGR